MGRKGTKKRNKLFANWQKSVTHCFVNLINQVYHTKKSKLKN